MLIEKENVDQNKGTVEISKGAYTDHVCYELKNLMNLILSMQGIPSPQYLFFKSQ